MEDSVKDLAITINGMKYTVRQLDMHFANFVENSLEDADVTLDSDNKADKLLYAYLSLAKRLYEQEKEIRDLIKSIEV